MLSTPRLSLATASVNTQEQDLVSAQVELGDAFTVCWAAHNQEKPAVFGHYVVWQDERGGDWDIYAYDLNTQQEFTVCTATGDQHFPAIYGNVVVWQDERNGNSDIYAYNLNAQEEFAVVTNTAAQ